MVPLANTYAWKNPGRYTYKFTTKLLPSKGVYPDQVKGVYPAKLTLFLKWIKICEMNVVEYFN